jgi:uncharacterized protein (TIGR02284 family)
MEKENEKIYTEIREILEKNRDAQKGFAKAAENAKDVALKEYFEKKSKDRKGFNEKLLTEIRAGYPQIKVEGSFAGTIHRAWMDVKALFAADDDESMLEEALRGDKAAIEEYNEVLDYKALPIGLRHLLNEQRETIRTDVRNNATLEDLK